MRPRSNTALRNALLLLGLLAYGAVAGRYCVRQQRQMLCTGLRVEVTDSAQVGFVTAAGVARTIGDSLGHPLGLPLAEVDVYAVERLVAENPYISQVQAYTTVDGVLRVRLWQHHPLYRILSEEGLDCYVDSTLTLLPPCAHYVAHVPVISGRVPLDTEKNSGPDKELLQNLLNFVGMVRHDPFLRALVVQIYRAEDGELWLLPRVGSAQVIRFGDLDFGGERTRVVGGGLTVEQRLDKLSKFYRGSFSDGWWKRHTGGVIDLRFRGQVVVTR